MLFKRITKSFLVILTAFFLLEFSSLSFATERSAELGENDSSYFVVRAQRFSKTATDLLGDDFMNPERVRMRIVELQTKLAELKGPKVAGSPSYSDSENLIGDKVDVSDIRYTERLVRLYESYLVMVGQTDDSDTPDSSAVADEALPSPPHSIRYYDTQRRNRDSLAKRLDRSNFALKLRSDEASLRIDTIKKSEYALKVLEGGASFLSLNPEYRLKVLEAEIDRVMLMICVGYIDTELEYNERSIEALAFSEAKLVKVRPEVVFKESELEEIVTDIEQNVLKRRDEISIATDELRKLSIKLSELEADCEFSVKKEIDERIARRNIYAAAGECVNSAERALLTAKIFANQYKLYASSNEIEMLNNAMTLWKSRYEIMRDSSDARGFWQTRTDALIAVDNMKMEKNYVADTLEDLRMSSVIVAGLINRALASGADLSLLEALRGLQRTLQETRDDIGSGYEAVILMCQSLSQAVIDETTEKMDFARIAKIGEERLSDFKNAFLSKVILQTDNFEITAYDITLAIGIIVLGYFLSALVSNLIAKIVRRKLLKVGADERLARTVKRVSFALSWLFFFMVASDSISVPLSAFAFMGGSLALAVGFGAQEICKNMLSGAIILFNRPFRPGDMVNIDGLIGYIGDVGLRSTLLITMDDIEVFVPNSYFIDNKVMNYTKSDPLIRLSFPVVVSSLFDAEMVESVLHEVIAEYVGESAEKVPFVSLSDVSRDANTFTLFYWLDVKRFDEDANKGDLRKIIIRKFAEHKIELYQPKFYRQQ